MKEYHEKKGFDIIIDRDKDIRLKLERSKGGKRGKISFS